jgi:hypothetical protein
VHFETDEAALLSIEKVNGMMIEDKIVYVGHFLKRSDRPMGQELFCNVYISECAEEGRRSARTRTHAQWRRPSGAIRVDFVT